MAIGKSKLSDMDFGSFESSVEKNIEADKTSDKFDRQLQAYKDAGVQLDAVRCSIDKTIVSLDDTVNKFNTAIRNVDAAAKTLDEFLVKVRDVKFETKIAAPDLKRLAEYQQQINADAAKLLEEHKSDMTDRLTNHFYEMSNMIARNKGIWLSNSWVKTLLWIFFPCTVFTIVAIVYFIASSLEK